MIAGGFFAAKNLLKLAAWALVIGGIIFAILYAANYCYQLGYVGGNDASEAKWEKKHAAAMELKAFNYKTLRETLRNRETEFGEIVDGLAKSHNEDQKNAELAREMAVAAVLDGTFRLHDPAGKWNGTGHGDECSGSDGKGELPTATAGTNGAGAGELSVEFTAFLVTEASRGDRITSKLGKLQIYTRELFKSCSSRKLFE